MKRHISFFGKAIPAWVVAVTVFVCISTIVIAGLLWARVEGDMVVSQAQLRLQPGAGFPPTLPGNLYPLSWLDSSAFRLEVPASSEENVKVYVNAVLTIADWPGLTGQYTVRWYVNGVRVGTDVDPGGEPRLYKLVPGAGDCHFLYLQDIPIGGTSDLLYFQIISTKETPPFVTSADLKWVFAGVPPGSPVPSCATAAEGEIWPSADPNY